MRLKGIVVPIVTPFDEAGHVDTEALKNLCEFLIEKGVHGLYPCGTTGEAVLLTTEERKLIAKVVVEQTGGRIPVFVHVGAATTGEAVELAKHAVEIGADGIAAVTPFYFGYSQEALIQYYEEILAVVPADYPVYLYNIPGCTGNDLLPKSVQYLAEKYPNIIGIKNSMPDLIRAMEYIECRENFSVVLGNDLLIAPGVLVGCDGAVSGNAEWPRNCLLSSMRLPRPKMWRLQWSSRRRLPSSPSSSGTAETSPCSNTAWPIGACPLAMYGLP